MKDNKNISTGVTYGVIIGLIYVLILFFRWSAATNLIKFGLYSFLGYLAILVLLCVEAVQRRKLDEGFINLKSLFQTLFISVLIFELFYSIYTYIHLKYIDPTVADRMREGMQEMFDKVGDQMSDEDKEKAMERMGDIKKVTELPQMIKSYLSSVAITGVFALIISAIVKKKKPVFEEVN
ncbi:DUF4199 domain-containing protein [Segetibacter aerophilus]|uniref:DUF4199 domain-containing protein n=1 Tax=Segetibacter aerophilus TaxID=670293 RepID=A0A512BDM9_9BACT|nr:DUF4199 domain-containing protein [Segetibacter aerophilus]GEO10044.1 hypothetical protein SAE01_25400 [Segetibacter aerophilus]